MNNFLNVRRNVLNIKKRVEGIYPLLSLCANCCTILVIVSAYLFIAVCDGVFALIVMVHYLKLFNSTRK